MLDAASRGRRRCTNRQDGSKLGAINDTHLLIRLSYPVDAAMGHGNITTQRVWNVKKVQQQLGAVMCAQAFYSFIHQLSCPLHWQRGSTQYDGN